MQNSQFAPTRPVDVEVANLYEYAKDLDRGTLVPHEKIEEITNVPRAVDGIAEKSSEAISADNPTYARIIRKWRKKMLDNDRPFPMNVKGVGYQLATIEQQNKKVPDAWERHIVKTAGKIKKVVEAIPVTQMTPQQRELAKLRNHQVLEIGDRIRSHRRERHSLLARPDSLPRPPQTM
jgi:hypothetical protein